MASVIGGTKLQGALSKITANVTTAKEVQIGFLAGATYPDGTSVPMVAALNEFGIPSKNQPPRPFFRQMIAAKSGEWPGAVGKLLKANDFDVAKTLDQAGAAIAGQLRQSIVDLTSPPLSPKTIKAKGFDKPLIDSGVMSNSVDHQVN